MKIQNWIDEVPIGNLDEWPEEKEAKRHERKVLLKMVERVKERLDAELDLLDKLQLLAQPIDLLKIRQLAEAEVNASAAFLQAEQELEEKRQMADHAKQALESAQAAR